jgi:hypothetical protein
MCQTLYRHDLFQLHIGFLNRDHLNFIDPAKNIVKTQNKYFINDCYFYDSIEQIFIVPYCI